MKQIIFAAALCVGIMSAGSAFAERWVTPVNGTVSAVTMPDGDVMLKIQLPPHEFSIMGRDMKDNTGSCIIKEVYPGEPNTMILVCK